MRLGDKSSYREIWIDKEQNTLVRTVDEIYNRSYSEKVYSIKSDVVTNEDDRDNILKNAPEEKDGSFVVPKTVD